MTDEFLHTLIVMKRMTDYKSPNIRHAGERNLTGTANHITADSESRLSVAARNGVRKFPLREFFKKTRNLNAHKYMHSRF